MKRTVYLSVILSITLAFAAFLGLHTAFASSLHHLLVSSEALPSTEALNSSSAVLFLDDFNDGNADGWTTSGAGTWYVEMGQYVVDMGTGTFREGRSMAGDVGWTDYVLELDIRADAGVDKPIFVRYSDDGNCYVINFRGSPYSDVQLQKRIQNGPFTMLRQVPYSQAMNV